MNTACAAECGSVATSAKASRRAPLPTGIFRPVCHQSICEIDLSGQVAGPLKDPRREELGSDPCQMLLQDRDPAPVTGSTQLQHHRRGHLGVLIHESPRLGQCNGGNRSYNNEQQNAVH